MFDPKRGLILEGGLEVVFFPGGPRLSFCWDLKTIFFTGGGGEPK